MIELSREYWDKEKTLLKAMLFVDENNKLITKHVDYDLSNHILTEIYIYNSDWHRSDGPAYIEYRTDGSIKIKYYWLNDIQYLKKDWIKAIKLLNIS